MTPVKKAQTLIIAEKPSVARDIVKCLDDQFKNRSTYFEGNAYLVSYAVGHLLTIAEPAEIDERFKTWSLKNLPILPEQYTLKPIKGTKMQLNALQKLLTRASITTIVNACDAGREGELIFRYIIDYVQTQSSADVQAAFNRKTIKRLWLQSMTEQSIKTAFTELKNNSDMQALSDAAKSRSEADWLVGINSSRGLTSFKSKGGGFFVTPCGRVQTPTLSMLIQREKEIEAFTPQPYSTLQARLTNNDHAYTGKWIDAAFKKSPAAPHARADRSFDAKRTAAIAKKCRQQSGYANDTSKESSELSPLLYDLTTLQREANTRFSYSAKRSLSILQSLYERHKLLTYPRTSSRYLPADYLSGSRKVFNKLAKLETPIAQHAQTAIAKKYIQLSPRIFNDKKVSDHHAIIPTEKTATVALDEYERKLYFMVLERFVGIFFPPAKSLKTTRITIVADEHFKTEGKIMLDPGWKVVSGRLEEDKLLAPLSPPDAQAKAYCEDVTIENLQTKPPPRYSEATLLSAMESAGKVIDDENLREAIKENGIGTPATRAAIIEKLNSDKYIIKESRELIPTAKAFDLFKMLETMNLEALTSPHLTGEWEHKLGLIEKGELSRNGFMHDITQNTIKLIASIQNYNEEADRTEASFSPINGEKFYKHLTYYKNEAGTLTIRAIIGGRRMNDDEIATLLRTRKVGPFKDFRSRKGVLFPATVQLDDSGKVKLSFMNEDEDITLETLQNRELIGKFHGDQSSVYKTNHAYISTSYLTPATKAKGLRLNRFILGKELDSANVGKMLQGEKSELILGFRSTRTQRLFDAFLELSAEGKLRFSFPPRKKKTAAAAETSA